MQSKCSPWARSLKWGAKIKRSTATIQSVGNFCSFFSHFSIFSVLCHSCDAPYYKCQPYLLYTYHNVCGRFLPIRPDRDIYLNASVNLDTNHRYPISPRLSILKTQWSLKPLLLLLPWAQPNMINKQTLQWPPHHRNNRWALPPVHKPNSRKSLISPHRLLLSRREKRRGLPHLHSLFPYLLVHPLRAG